MAAVLASEAGQRGLPYRLYSLNDGWGPHRGRVGDVAFEFAGFHRSKTAFGLAVLRSIRQRPRVVLAAHPHLAPLGLVVKRLTGGRMATVGWGIDVWDPLPRVRRWALSRSDAVLAISSYTAGRMVAVQQVKSGAVRLLPLAVEPVFWQTAEDHQRHPGPRGPGSRRYLLSVTRLSASENYKGVDTVIRALARLSATFSEVDYLIVGDGDDRPRLERLSRELGVADRVRFLGEYDWLSPELLALYAHCEALVLPSRGEGFGLVFLEAMAFGKPVVGGAHGGTPDFVEDGVTGLLTPYGDVPVLADVLGRLLSDGCLRSAIGGRARESVRARYLFEHFHARLGAVVEELCAA